MFIQGCLVFKFAVFAFWDAFNEQDHIVIGTTPPYVNLENEFCAIKIQKWVDFYQVNKYDSQLKKGNHFWLNYEGV